MAGPGRSNLNTLSQNRKLAQFLQPAAKIGRNRSLKRKIKSECEISGLETFKHELGRVLRVDYADFKMTSGKPMTVDLGEAIRDLLAAIFDHLRKQGINAKD
jgi:hypothetical protein